MDQHRPWGSRPSTETTETACDGGLHRRLKKTSNLVPSSGNSMRRCTHPSLTPTYPYYSLARLPSRQEAHQSQDQHNSHRVLPHSSATAGFASHGGRQKEEICQYSSSATQFTFSSDNRLTQRSPGTDSSPKNVIHKGRHPAIVYVASSSLPTLWSG